MYDFSRNYAFLRNIEGGKLPITLFTPVNKLLLIFINGSIEDAVWESDVVTTLTPSKEAYLDINWLKSNCHINAVGADAKGKRELMTNVIDGSANIICDDPEQAAHSGELQYNEWPFLDVNSLEHLIKNYKNMQLNKGISVFDSTGVAIEDIAIGILLYRLYNKL